jgi:hypothetical protein
METGASFASCPWLSAHWSSPLVQTRPRRSPSPACAMSVHSSPSSQHTRRRLAMAADLTRQTLRKEVRRTHEDGDDDADDSGGDASGGDVWWKEG